MRATVLTRLAIPPRTGSSYLASDFSQPALTEIWALGQGTSGHGTKVRRVSAVLTCPGVPTG
jgi:hypothetical protein